MGLRGEHLIPPKHAWQRWRSVTNPAPVLGTRAAPHTPAAGRTPPAPASVNTLVGRDCCRNRVNKEVAAQPGHQVTPASHTAHARPAVLCPAAHSPDTEGMGLGASRLSRTIPAATDAKGALPGTAFGPGISPPLGKATRVFSHPPGERCTVPWGETLMLDHRGRTSQRDELLHGDVSATEQAGCWG